MLTSKKQQSRNSTLQRLDKKQLCENVLITDDVIWSNAYNYRPDDVISNQNIFAQLFYILSLLTKIPILLMRQYASIDTKESKIIKMSLSSRKKYLFIFELQCRELLFHQIPFYVLNSPNWQCYFTTQKCQHPLTLNTQFYH